MSLNQNIYRSIVQNSRILVNLVIPIIFIGFFLLISFSSVANKSDTTDEKFHLTRGIMLLTTGDLRINQHHPYLLNLIDAIPAVFNPELEVPDTDSENWQQAKKDELSFDLVKVNGGNERFSQVILYGPRVFGIITTSILLVIAYFLTIRLFGPLVAVVMLAFISTDPNFIAHSRLVTTDASSALIIYITALIYFLYMKGNEDGQYSYKQLLSIALVSFVALMSKYTSVFVVLPLILLVGFDSFLKLRNGSFDLKKRTINSLKNVLIISSVIFIALFVAYKFQFGKMIDMAYGNQPKIEANFNAFETYNDKIPGFGSTMKYIYENVPLPFPQYINGFYENVFKHNFFGHSSFFMGEFSKDGWILYFPVAYITKEPIGTLLFVVGSLILGGVLIWKKKPKLKIYHLALLLPPLIIGSLSLISSINLGIRHILPIFPFIFLFGGIVINSVVNKENFLKIGTPILIFVMMNVYAVISVYPHYISYFNELVGGSSEGYQYLRDSNFDWDQNYLYVLDYIDEKNDKEISIVPDQSYGFDYLILRKEVLYSNPDKRSESINVINERIDAGEYKIIDEIAFTHVVIDLGRE